VAALNFGVNPCKFGLGRLFVSEQLQLDLFLAVPPICVPEFIFLRIFDGSGRAGADVFFHDHVQGTGNFQQVDKGHRDSCG